MIISPVHVVWWHFWAAAVHPEPDSTQTERVRRATVDFHDNLISWSLNPHAAPSCARGEGRLQLLL